MNESNSVLHLLQKYIKEGRFVLHLVVRCRHVYRMMLCLIYSSNQSVEISQRSELTMIVIVTGVYHFDLQLQEAQEPAAAA